MLLYLSVFGIFLSLILIGYNRRKYRSSVYLGLFFFLISLYAFYQYVLLYSGSVTLISLFLFNLSIDSSPVYLIGPMLYWYIRSVLTDDPKLKRIDLWHFLPAFIFFIAALPNAFVPWSEKVETARAVVHDTGYIMTYNSTLLDRIFPNVFIYVSRLLLVLGYALWAMGILIRYLREKNLPAVFSTQRFMKKWLFYLLGFVLILVVSQIYLVGKSFEMYFSELFFTINIIRVISALGLIGLLISPFFFPAILYGLPRLPQPIATTESVSAKQQNVADSHKRNFETEYLQSIGWKVNVSMKEDQPYLQPDCNLSYVSKLVDVPAHHLAYYFREVKKQPFNDFRNEWRINHAKALIEEGKASEITLEAIGMLSGFSSRNAFITDFKKTEGISPGAYAARYN